MRVGEIPWLMQTWFSELVGGKLGLGIVCTRFVRRLGKHGILFVPGIHRISKLIVFNTDGGFDRRLPKKTFQDSKAINSWAVVE